MTTPMPDDRTERTRTLLIAGIIVLALAVLGMGAWAVLRPKPNSSGKRAGLREIAIHDIANGKIVRERFYYDPSFMQAAQPEAPAAQPTA